jgi:hypothetical protein
MKKRIFIALTLFSGIFVKAQEWTDDFNNNLAMNTVSAVEAESSAREYYGQAKYKKTCPGVIIKEGEHIGPDLASIPNNVTYSELLSHYGFSKTGKDLCIYYRDASDDGNVRFQFWREDTGKPGNYNPSKAEKSRYAVSLCGTSIGVDAKDLGSGDWRLPNIAELGQMSIAAAVAAPKYNALSSVRDGDVRTIDMRSNFYWSNTEFGTESAVFWYYCYTGTFSFDKTVSRYIRCVKTME